MEPALEFEKPISTLEKKLSELRDLSKQDGVNLSAEIAFLEKRLNTLISDTFSKLSPWQRVQLSRHPSRPYAEDYIRNIFPDFIELKGDRTFYEDAALVCGTATFSFRSGDPVPVMIIAQQKGRSTKQKLEHNFGMVRPEGYRKAMRIMTMAERFKMPLITLIDTPGAYPGIDAEERGQSQAIAECLVLMSGLKIPTLSVVIGEGGSGGALAIGISDSILMLEYSTYSVISPESCAAILWSDSSLGPRAAEALKINATDLQAMRVIDAIIKEPLGGAHRDHAAASQLLHAGIKKYMLKTLRSYEKDPEKLLKKRHLKYRQMGTFALSEAHSVDGSFADTDHSKADADHA